MALHPQFSELIGTLVGSGPTVVFGGFVRDAIHSAVHRIKVPVRDVDLVLDGDIPSALRGGTRTRFGGYRVVLGEGLKVDYWALGETMAFQRKVVETTFSNLPKSTVFTVNSCIFHLGSKRLEECNAVRDVRRRRIAFQCLAYSTSAPNTRRIVYLAMLGAWGTLSTSK